MCNVFKFQGPNSVSYKKNILQCLKKKSGITIEKKYFDYKIKCAQINIKKINVELYLFHGINKVIFMAAIIVGY